MMRIRSLKFIFKISISFLVFFFYRESKLQKKNGEKKKDSNNESASALPSGALGVSESQGA
jgi:hypothetical protein